ncbi:hypothetical protein CANCADRAFT_4227 [Tortispora caseinolytica NRRL Y-17796]|uniref:Uncharacterized protein n=1 Tax=Tortispora caseinolytica NRRL Y-17796 TaxID=767744 RepID=A0A1E4TD77_9ASCO|nr:hypothetical protein CANCADRAFT_4227 [Tortispora caseinolytica NRRL Y-17796]
MSKYIDIAVNLTDPMFSGLYYGKAVHSPDLPAVLQRARDSGVVNMLITGSNLTESRIAKDIAESNNLGFTVGVHPCCSADIVKEEGYVDDLQYIQQISLLAKSSPAVRAYGEMGLDYDRFHYADQETQIRIFKMQIDIAVQLQLPLFLHCRAAFADFKSILFPRLPDLPSSGVVHSFTGTKDEMKEIIDHGLYIGINGCSLKTEENLEVVTDLPLDRLMLETDAPWCEIRPSHASAKYISSSTFPSVKKEKYKLEIDKSVKGRCEPFSIHQVAEVIANVKQVPLATVTEAAFLNSAKMFFPELL